jgi:hypothetical protein
VTVTTAHEAPVLAECRREIRRLHGCTARFERFALVPAGPGRARRVVAVFELEGHAAHQCFAWPERAADGVAIVAVLRSMDVRDAEEAVRHVTAHERSSRERWAQDYA